MKVPVEQEFSYHTREVFIMALTIETAEPLIIEQWRTWSQESDSNKITDMMKFHFSWLPKNRPDLLVFKSKIDKWHVVHGWLQGFEDIQAPRRNPSRSHPTTSPQVPARSTAKNSRVR